LHGIDKVRIFASEKVTPHRGTSSWVVYAYPVAKVTVSFYIDYYHIFDYLI